MHNKKLSYLRESVILFLLFLSGLLTSYLVVNGSTLHSILINISATFLSATIIVLIIDYSKARAQSASELVPRKKALDYVQQDQIQALQFFFMIHKKSRSRFISEWTKILDKKDENNRSIIAQNVLSFVRDFRDEDPSKLLNDFNLNSINTTLKSGLEYSLKKLNRTIERYSFSFTDHKTKLCLVELERSLSELVDTFVIFELLEDIHPMTKKGHLEDNDVKDIIAWPLKKYMEAYLNFVDIEAEEADL